MGGGCRVRGADPADTVSAPVLHRYVTWYGFHVDTYARFMSKVEVGPGCWLWRGTIGRDGYPQFWFNGGTRRGARWLLGYLRGKPLASSEWALHRCDNPPCVNPDHLYVGDVTDNTRDRGDRTGHGSSLSRDNAAKTECPSGHPYDDVNTYVYRGARICRKCRAALVRRRYWQAKK